MTFFVKVLQQIFVKCMKQGVGCSLAEVIADRSRLRLEVVRFDRIMLADWRMGSIFGQGGGIYLTRGGWV